MSQNGLHLSSKEGLTNRARQLGFYLPVAFADPLTLGSVALQNCLIHHTNCLTLSQNDPEMVLIQKIAPAVRFVGFMEMFADCRIFVFSKMFKKGVRRAL